MLPDPEKSEFDKKDYDLLALTSLAYLVATFFSSETIT